MDAAKLHQQAVEAYESGDRDRAEGYCHTCLALASLTAVERHGCLLILGSIELERGQVGASIKRFTAITAENEQNAAAFANLGGAYFEAGQYQAAAQAYDRALAIQPGHRTAASNRLFLLHYDSRHSARDILGAHRQWGSNLRRAVVLERGVAGSTRRERLRVGYLSPDFRDGSVGYFATALLEHHDPRVVEVACYSTTLSPDQRSGEMRAAVENRGGRWHEIGRLSDAQAVSLIARDDRIDILVDLAGHVAGNRLGIFAARAAPVQLTYIGYPNSTGLAEIQYRISDSVADPPGQCVDAHEGIWRLNRCFLGYTPPHKMRQHGRKAEAWKARSFLRLASFNVARKVNPGTTALWSRLLRALPHARLTLKSRCFTESYCCERYLAGFAAHGIDGSRIDLLPWGPFDQHVQLYNDVDLALDPAPYNGTTTTCEALWLGVPVLTMIGSSHVSRVGHSLIRSLGSAALEDSLVAVDETDFLRKGVALAGSSKAMAAVHAELARVLTAGEPQIFDTVGLTRSVESAYQAIWSGYDPVPGTTSSLGVPP